MVAKMVEKEINLSLAVLGAAGGPAVDALQQVVEQDLQRRRIAQRTPQDELEIVLDGQSQPGRQGCLADAACAEHADDATAVSHDPTC